MADEQQAEQQPRIEEPVERKKPEDYIPIENLDDLRARVSVWEAESWAPIFPDVERENLYRESFRSIDESGAKKSKELGDTEIDSKELMRIRDEEIEEQVASKLKAVRDDIETARNSFLDAESIEVMQKNFVVPETTAFLRFHEDDYRQADSQPKGRKSQIRLIYLLAALNLDEKNMVGLVNSMRDFSPNLGKEGFYQMLSDMAGKRVNANLVNDDVSKEFLPRPKKPNPPLPI